MHWAKTILSRSRNRPNEWGGTHYFHHLLHKCAARTNNQRRSQHHAGNTAVANLLFGTEFSRVICGGVGWTCPQCRHLHEPFHTTSSSRLNQISSSLVMRPLKCIGAMLVNDANEVDYGVASCN